MPNEGKRTSKLPAGKVSDELLRRIVFKHLGAPSSRLLVPPGVGVDAAVIDRNSNIIVVSTDPITGAVEDIGWLAVHINANDVACHGGVPRWFFATILLPEWADEELLERIMKQMDSAAKELGVTIAGGHTEVTPGLDRPIVVGVMIGEVERGTEYVSTTNAEPGDMIIMTKGAGVEGTAILATERERDLRKYLDKSLIERAKSFKNMISVVREALTAIRCGGVKAMHDPTEGGVLGGLHEVCDASGTGFIVESEKIKIYDETMKICRIFEIDPLRLISSGTLLIIAKKKSAGKIVESLRSIGVDAEIIGYIVDDKRRRFLVRRDGKCKKAPRPVQDHLWIALEKKL
ncbi:MAG: AIR synthase family protein [Candidatus Baldrarchaeia archaeon]